MTAMNNSPVEGATPGAGAHPGAESGAQIVRAEMGMKTVAVSVGTKLVEMACRWAIFPDLGHEVELTGEWSAKIDGEVGFNRPGDPYLGYDIFDRARKIFGILDNAKIVKVARKYTYFQLSEEQHQLLGGE